MVKSITFSVNDKVLNEFRTLCKENAINQSAWINLKMKEFIVDNNERIKNGELKWKLFKSAEYIRDQNYQKKVK